MELVRHSFPFFCCVIIQNLGNYFPRAFDFFSLTLDSDSFLLKVKCVLSCFLPDSHFLFFLKTFLRPVEELILK